MMVRCVEHAAKWRRLEMYTKLWLGSLNGSDQLEDRGINGIILKWILRKYSMRMWAGIMWLNIGTSGRLL
jgi:hypothetical protein